MFNDKSLKMALIFTVVLITLGACSSAQATTHEHEQDHDEQVKEITYYDWEEDMPQSVLDAFSEEHDIKVNYVTYETQEEALANIRAGQVYDVVVIDNDFIPQMIAEDLLAEIDYSHIPNFKNIGANFRDLAYDPGNMHTIPFNWGTTGLVVRDDLIKQPITSWGDLWDIAAVDQIGLRDEPRDQLGAALKALGYSVNTEQPEHIEAALEHLLKIRQNVVIVDSYAEAAIPMLARGEIVALIGWAQDVQVAQAEGQEKISYVLPEDGPMLWGDNFVIPANSPNKHTAELFLDFIMRPEINAQIINENYYASANQGARDFVDPEILNDVTIFPPNEKLVNGEVYLPLSSEAEALYQETWEQFKAAGQ